MSAPSGGYGQDPFDLVVSKLDDVKPTPRGVRARCPVHEGPGSTPSLYVDRGEDGRVLICCRSGGCAVEDIVEAIGLQMSDLFTHDKKSRAGGAKQKARKRRYPDADAVAEMFRAQIGGSLSAYDYHNADGRHVGRVMRFDVEGHPKQIRQASLEGDAWVAGAMPEPRPLYRLPAILEDPETELVFVTEGERCADAVIELGLVGTTSSQGAQSAGKTDWSPLGSRRVVLLPDNDDAGRDYGQVVAGLLHAAGASQVVNLALESLADGEDVYDWIETKRRTGHSTEQIAEELYELASKAPSVEADAQVEATDEEATSPFPLSALPQFCREMVVSGARAQGVDPAFYAVPMLAILGGCVGNSRRVEIKRGWSEPAVIWTALVAPSGSGKSPPQRELLRPVQKRDYELYQQVVEKQRDYEAAMLRYKKDSGDPPPEPPPMLAAIVDDATLEALAARLEHNPRGLLLANDELAGFLKSFNKYRAGDDQEKWLRIHGADMIKIDRKGGLGKGPKRIYVRHAAVSVVGTIQPKIAAKYLSGEKRESGLTARLLVAAPPTRPVKWTDKTIPAEAQKNWRKITESLLDLTFDPEKGPKLLPLDESAQQLFIEFHDANVVATYAEGQSGDGDIAAALAKLRGYAARFALLIELARATEDGTAVLVESIGAKSMRAGILVVEWFEGEIRRLYAQWSRATPEAEQKLDERVHGLLKNGPLSEGEIRGRLHRNLPSAEVYASLKRLEAKGMVRFLGKQPSGPVGGRPREVWIRT